MRDAIIAVLAVACVGMYVQWQNAQDGYQAAMEYAAGLEAAAKAGADRAKRDEKLKKGGADEALSDYGRDAARILWPSD